MKRTLSLILALCMVFSLMPLTIQAASGTETARLERQHPEAAPQAAQEPVETNGSYSVSISYTGKGKVQLYSTSANAGDAVYFLADPDPGYLMDASYSYIVGGYEGAMYYVGKNLCMLYMPSCNTEITVTFTPASGSNHNISLDVWAGGTVTLNQQKAKPGESVFMDIAAKQGYEFIGIEAYTASGAVVDLYDVSDSEDVLSVEFTMPNEDVRITVGFELVGNPFEDVKTSDFFYDSVMWAVNNGITTGIDDSHFAPYSSCNRAQVVTFLWRAFGSPAPSSRNNPFTDVPNDTWYTDAVLWAVENGITNGTGAGKFEPNRVCNRAQVVTFLWRAIGSPNPASRNNPFTDVPNDSFYYTPVLWALEHGITTGASATTFDPNGQCLRAHVVTFLYRTVLSQN